MINGLDIETEIGGGLEVGAEAVIRDLKTETESGQGAGIQLQTCQREDTEVTQGLLIEVTPLKEEDLTVGVFPHLTGEDHIEEDGLIVEVYPPIKEEVSMVEMPGEHFLEGFMVKVQSHLIE